MIVKVCGLRDAANIGQVAALGVDWTGLIFYPKSPRYVTEVVEIPSSVKRVGVFVNEQTSIIRDKVEEFGLDMVQLHGKEPKEYVDELRAVIPSTVKVIKAISVSEASDIDVCSTYDNVDFFLFDTKCVCVGGSGSKLDWSVLDNYNGDVPFLLSGGIGASDAGSVMEIKHPMFAGVDLNSRFEIEPGLKDVELLKQFIGKIKHQ